MSFCAVVRAAYGYCHRSAYGKPQRCIIKALKRLYFIIPLPAQTCEKMFNRFYHRSEPVLVRIRKKETIKRARLINGVFRI